MPASPGIEVLWNGSSIATCGAGFNRSSAQTLTVTGNKVGADLLSFRALGQSDALGTSLDKVSLIAAVPEPETYGMLLAGLGLIGFIARRRLAAK